MAARIALSLGLMLMLTLALVPSRALERVLASGNGLTLTCVPPSGSELRCDFRVASAARPLGAEAKVGNILLAPPQFAARASEGDPVALLLLVDETLLGNGERRATVVRHVTRLLASAPAHHRFGLALYGGQLRVLAPIGSESELIISELTAFKGGSDQRLLYRSAISATQLLTTTTPRHKALVMISGGASDDQQMDHVQAVREARNRGVVVYALGYPGVQARHGLDRLERLSEDTGGVFLAANAAGNLSDEELARPFAGLDNTGALSVDLSGAMDKVAPGEHRVSIVLDTASGAVSAIVPVYLAGADALNAPLRPIEVRPNVAPAPSAGESPRAPRGPVPVRDATNTVLIWGLAIAALVLVLVLAMLITMLVVRRRRQHRPEAVSSPRTRVRLDGPADAYVVMADGDMRSHHVSTPLFKIGRMGNNDLVLDDPSVSRHHAEIRCARDGSYSIADLDSMNGIYVNGRRIRGCALTDGDELEVGDVRLSFEIRHDDPLDRDATAAVTAPTR